MLKLLDLPVDLLFLIAKDIDAASVTRLSASCRKLRKLLHSFSNLIFKNIARRDFKITRMPKNIRSYHQLVLAHESLKRGICFPLDDDWSSKVPTHYLMAWPVHEANAYLVALSGNFLIWVDIENMRKMYVKDLRMQNWENDDLILGDYTLRGHTSRIGLILANNDGLLVSFDVSCDIYVWNVNHQKLERKINAGNELGMIMSMNLYNNSVVCAGINGKIAVWDASTGRLTHSFTIPSKYLDVLEENQLNVSIYDDLVAFGLSDGKFYIYSLVQQKITKEFDVMKENTRRTRMIPDHNNNHMLDIVEQATEAINVDMMTTLNADESLRNDLEDLEAERTITLQNLERTDNNTDTENEENDILDRFPLHDSSVPLTLSLSSHFLLTNGPEPSCLALWDVREGSFMGFLDHNRISRMNRSRLGPLRFAEISVDSSMIYSVSGDLMVWNFMNLENSESAGVKRYFIEGKLHLGDDIWIGYETHETLEGNDM